MYAFLRSALFAALISELDWAEHSEDTVGLCLAFCEVLSEMLPSELLSAL